MNTASRDGHVTVQYGFKPLQNKCSFQSFSKNENFEYFDILFSCFDFWLGSAHIFIENDDRIIYGWIYSEILSKMILNESFQSLVCKTYTVNGRSSVCK